MAMDVARVFQLLDQMPFIPFEVELVSGRRIPVTHPENVVIFPDRARVREILVYYPDRDDYSIIWPYSISALHVAGRSESQAG